MDIVAILVLLLPLIGAVANGLLNGRLSVHAMSWLSAGLVLLSFLLSLYFFVHLYGGGEPIRTPVYTFLAVDSLRVHFSLRIDGLSAWMMLLVTGIGSLIQVYSSGYLKDQPSLWRFFAYVNLSLVSMLLLVMSDNLVMMFAGWMGLSLSSYLLVSFQYANRVSTRAARKLFFVNSIGDVGLLLGLLVIFGAFNSYAYSEVFELLPRLRLDSATGVALGGLLLVSVVSKSAQVPLFTWLPDSAIAPMPALALMQTTAGVMGGLYLAMRCYPLLTVAPLIHESLALIGLVTSLLAGLIALRQHDVNRILTYSTVAQLGLTFLALGTGLPLLAMLCATAHALSKATLFASAGLIVYALGGEQDIRRMGGLCQALPIAYWTFLWGALIIVAVPVLSGVSIWGELLANTRASLGISGWLLVTMSSGLSALYLSRLFFAMFFNASRGTEEHRIHLRKYPHAMAIPPLVLASLSLVSGFLCFSPLMPAVGADWLIPFLHRLFGETHAKPALPASMVWLFVSPAMLLVLGAIVGAYWFYVVHRHMPVYTTSSSKVERILTENFYLDKFYDWMVVRPMERLSQLLYYYVEVQAMEGSISGIGKAVQRLGTIFRRRQNTSNSS